MASMSYLGCYQHLPTSELGSIDLPYAYEGYDPTRCSLRCKNVNAEYAWLSDYGRNCFCSQSPPKTENKVLETECNSKCRRGDSMLACGSKAGKAHSVYQVSLEEDHESVIWVGVQVELIQLESLRQELRAKEAELKLAKEQIQQLSSTLPDVKALAKDEIRKLGLCEETGFSANWTESLLYANIDTGVDTGVNGDSRRSVLQIVQDRDDLAKKALEVQVIEAQIAGIRQQIEWKESTTMEEVVGSKTCSVKVPN